MTDWALVIPVKSFGTAKSRLGGSDTAGPDGLAAALAYDSIQAAREARAVSSCVVVCDQRTAGWATAWGADAVVEEPGGGLNAALRLGRDVALSQGQPAVAFMMADLPLLTVGHLEALLDRAPPDRPGAVSDLTGEGTTLLLSRRGEELQPCFGVGSFAAHRLGAEDLSEHCDRGLRLDLDTWEDLAQLDRPVGLRTRQWYDRRLMGGISCRFPAQIGPTGVPGADFSTPALPV